MDHSSQRVPSNPYVMRTPLHCLLHHFKFCPTPLSVASNLYPLPFLMSCFFDWMGECATFDVLFHLILWILLNIEPRYLNTTTTLLCVSRKYTQRYRAHSGTSRLTHPYKYILTPPAKHSQQLSVLHWIIHWYQKSTFHNVFCFKKLHTCRSCISVH